MANESKFVNFLVEAKKSKFNNSGKKENSSKPNSIDYSYQKQDCYYLDSRIGDHDFIGQELIWQKENVCWGMNYSGQVLVTDLPAGFNSFLNEALSKVETISPFRGPDFFEKNKFKYKCNWEGDIFSFKGEEVVCYDNEPIFKLNFHGSYIR